MPPSEKEIREETSRIQAFALSEIEPKEGSKVSMVEVFTRYEDWAASRGFVPLEMTIDSFGRLFPKTFPRRIIVHAGKTARGIIGHALRRA